jgi:hypothetical protein
METGKPVAVLAGWLGCQPRNLRRYRDMYDRYGWATVIGIGSARSVVAAMTKGPFSCQTSQSEMKSLAITILRKLQTIQPPHFVFHIFSNNGCVLWEWFRFILLDQSSSSSSFDSTVDIHNLKRKLIGVVFDSAPANYDGKTDTLQSALKYVPSLTERKHLLKIASTLDPHVVKQRFDDFWGGLCNDSMDTPQFYIYSESDELASAKELERLIAYRRDLIGRSKIWNQVFQNSEHCDHLQKHPEVYHGAIKRFLSFCIGQGRDMCHDLEYSQSRRARL